MDRMRWSSACSLTSDWRKMTHFSGSRPTLSQSTATSNSLALMALEFMYSELRACQPTIA